MTTLEAVLFMSSISTAFPDLLYLVAIHRDTSAARTDKLCGILLVLHHANIKLLYEVVNSVIQYV